MKRVKIIFGCYGADNGHGSVTVINRGESCEVDDAEALRLIALGVAAEAVATPSVAQGDVEQGENTSDSESGSGEQEKPPFDEDELLAMTNDALRHLGESMGLRMGKCRNKADFVSTILAALDNPDSDENPPDLNAEDPV